MLRKQLYVIFLIALLAIAFIACSKISADNQNIIDQAVDQGCSGIQAYVRKESKEWFGVAGVSSVETKRPLTLDDRIRVASITKMMTYAVVMEFVKNKRINLNDHVISILPHQTLAGIPYADQITVAHLLDHQSGLHNFNGEPGNDFFSDLYSNPNRGSRVFTAMELLAYAKKTSNPPTGRPGESTSYSSTGYIVLELILEKISGKTLAQLYREYLFDPLEMKSAGVEGGDLKAAQITDSYASPDPTSHPNSSPFLGRKSVRSDGLINVSSGLDFYNSWARAAGAVALNIKDLSKFMAAVEKNRFKVIKNQEMEIARVKGRPKGYFDWNGGSIGIQATILYSPSQDVTVIVLKNASNAGESSHDLAKKLLEETMS